jgi:BlaI family penicillinase repressor
MKQVKQLSDLQIDIMRPLWERGEMTAAQVHEAVQPVRGLAATTVATLLSRLEKQGLVAHRSEGRQYVYRALASEPDVRRSMVHGLIEHLFGGNSAALVSHLLQESEIDSYDLARVKSLIESKEKEEQDSGK